MVIGLKNDVIEKLSLENQGVLKTSDVLAAGVTKDAFYRYIKERGLEKAAHGVYVSPDVFPDEMYLLQVQFPKAIFSHEAALYLHNLAEKEPLPFSVTVAANYNSRGLVEKGVKVYYTKADWYAMGICLISSNGGHFVHAYDMERTICDIIRKRSDMDSAAFNYAIREYMKKKDKNLVNLSHYASVMQMEKQVNEVMGVLF